MRFTRLISAAHGVPKGLTVYVSSGSRDPVSTGTKMLQPMLAQYQAAGLKVQHKFYLEARHELLNEKNREEVIADLLSWMGSVVSRRENHHSIGERR
jgi:alpha-beta hydrolase superfamily lysophospholipase